MVVLVVLPFQQSRGELRGLLLVFRCQIYLIIATFYINLLTT